MAKETTQGDFEDLETKVAEAREELKLSDFEGTKHKIVSATVVDRKSNFDPTTGKRLGKDELVPVKKLRVETDVITTLKTSKGDFDIRATEEFKLKYDTDDSKWKIPIAAKDTDAKYISDLEKFFRRMGVKKVSELKGKSVVVRIRKGGDGKDYLGFLRE